MDVLELERRNLEEFWEVEADIECRVVMKGLR